VRALVVALLVGACSSSPSSDAISQRSGSSVARDASPREPVPERVRVIGDRSYLEPPLKRAFDPVGFEPMPEPQPGDWLAEHPEVPQSYDDFAQSETNVPTEARHVLYLLPIGTFGPEGAAPSLDALRDIVHAYFTLEVRVLPAVTVAAVGAKSRTNSATHARQLLAPDVLAWLAKRVPDDAYGLMAVTMVDLYPEESWNFVFGMASLKERVGVQSFARHDPAFFGEPRTLMSRRLQLRRAAWTLVHEISHMFGLSHCVYWRCVVAGSNNQAEADRAPLHACPVCLRKLWSAIRFDPAAREEALAATLRRLGIDDEAEWSEQRARWIRTGKR
jgi:archaemetzincin